MFAPVFIALLALVHPASSQNTIDSGSDKSLDFQADHQNPVRIQVKYPSAL
jgi:hypothetical protein